jgi:hypothetical protein
MQEQALVEEENVAAQATLEAGATTEASTPATEVGVAVMEEVKGHYA